MSRRLLAAAAFASGLAASAQAQTPLLRFTEVTRSGATHAVSADSRAVDVNSEVHVRIDREALRLAAGGATLPQQVLDDAAALTQVLRGANEDLAAMRAAASDYTAAESAERREALIAALRPLGQRARTVLAAARPGTALRARINAALVPGMTPEAQYGAVFAAAADHVAELRRQVETVAASEGVRVRMGAWLVNDRGSREVHLPGFDTVRTQAPSVVPSFQIFLTEEQAAQFRALAAEARFLRQQTSATPFGDVTVLHGRLRAIAASGLGCLEALPGQLAALGANDPALRSLLAHNQLVVQAWSELRTRYTAGVPAPADLLTTGPRDAAALWSGAQAWLGAADRVLGAAAPAAGTAAATARGALATCRSDVHARLVNDLGPLVTSFAGDPARRLALESLEFSERVLSLDLGSVPGETRLSLITAGTREPGDQLAFRMSTVDASGRERMVASRSFVVQRAEPHLHLTVAMLWAWRDPPRDERGNSRGNQWHPAPSYSILAKRFFGDSGYARRHPLYAEVLNPGIGLNLSAPDFDLDDTPEFAAGAVLSVFRDYIQGGYSYNFQRDKPFFFIGIRLPLPSATLPATESGTVGG